MVIFNTYVKLPIWVCNSLHHFLANVFNDTWCDQQRGSVVPEAWEHWLTGCCGRSLTNQALSRRLQAGVQESEDENPGYPWFMVTPKRLILVGKWWWTFGFLGFNIFKQCQWETESEERGIKGDFAHGISWITLATQVAELPWQFGFRPQWSCRDCFQSAPRIAATHDRALPDARVQSGWNTCVECETHMLAPRHGLMTSSNHQLTCTYRTCTQLTLTAYCSKHLIDSCWLFTAQQSENFQHISQLCQYGNTNSSKLIAAACVRKDPTPLAVQEAKGFRATWMSETAAQQHHEASSGRASKRWVHPWDLHSTRCTNQTILSSFSQNLRRVIANWCFGVNVLSGSNMIGFQLGKWQCFEFKWDFPCKNTQVQTDYREFRVMNLKSKWINAAHNYWNMVPYADNKWRNSANNCQLKPPKLWVAPAMYRLYRASAAMGTCTWNWRFKMKQQNANSNRFSMPCMLYSDPNIQIVHPSLWGTGHRSLWHVPHWHAPRLHPIRKFKPGTRTRQLQMIPYPWVLFSFQHSNVQKKSENTLQLHVLFEHSFQWNLLNISQAVVCFPY